MKHFYRALLGIALLFPSLSPAAVNSLHLSFEGDVRDSSGHGYHGTTSGPGVTFTDGTVDEQALSFDGSGDTLRVDHAGQIDLRSSHTIMFFIQVHDGEVNGLVMREGHGSRIPGGNSVWLDTDRGVGDGLATYEVGTVGQLSSLTPVNDGAWHHVAFVFDADFIVERNLTGVVPHLDTNRVVRGTISCYIDGTLDNQLEPGQGTLLFRIRQALSDTLWFGDSPDPFPDRGESSADERNALRANLDEFRIFEGPLTGQQIAAIAQTDRNNPLTCPADDTSVASVDVRFVTEYDTHGDGIARPVPAGTILATANGGADLSGDPIWYTFTLTREGGPNVRHGTPLEIGPKTDNEKTFPTTVGDPPVVAFHTVSRQGNTALFRGVSEGTYTVTVEVTDLDNLPCKDFGDVAGLGDNEATSASITVAPLPGFVYKISSFGAGKQLWYNAEERIVAADGLFQLGDPGGWGIVDHPAAYGGKVLTRIGADSLFGGGLRGGRLVHEFDTSLAGMETGLHYFWSRNINQFDTSDFGAVPGHPGDANLPGAPNPVTGSWAGNFSSADDRLNEENTNWAMGWQRLDLVVRPQRGGEGHAKVLQGGVNQHWRFHRQGANTKVMDVHMWTDDPLYMPTDEDLNEAMTLNSFRRGDCNGDGLVDISDGLRMLGTQFLGEAPPDCLDACDFNGAGRQDVTAAVFFFASLFGGGSAIPEPRSCGFGAPLVGCASATCDT